MSYDAWKCASPEEGLDLYPDDETTTVEECVHGEHPLECSMCTSAGLHAAVIGIRTLGPNPGEWSECGECGAMFPSESHCNNCAAVGCEGDDMETKHWSERTEAKAEDDIFTMPLAGMTALELVSARDRVVAELKRRAPELERELEMVTNALSGKTPRATRRDKGTHRARKVEAA